MIHVERLQYRYPGSDHDAIDGLTLDVPAGSLFGLLGPNGSGKTTFISLLMGLLAPRAGRIEIEGGPASRRAALVPQEYAFYDRLSVLENLRFFAGVCGVAPERREERIAAVTDTAGLAGFLRVRAQRLSGGLKRRLNLAIGLLGEPRLLFLDEPTVGIDPQSRHFILESIRAINAAGTTVVYTSHYMEEVQALCDEIGILDRGRLLAHGTLESLLNSGAGQLRVGLDARPHGRLLEALGRFEGLRVEGTELRWPECTSSQLHDLLGEVRDHGGRVNRVRYGHADLEALFLHLTGHQLRD